MLWYHMCNSHLRPAVFGIRPTAVVVHLTKLVLGAHTSRSNVLSLAASENYCRLEGTYCACKGVQLATVVLGFGSVNRILHGWSVQGRRGRRARLRSMLRMRPRSAMQTRRGCSPLSVPALATSSRLPCIIASILKPTAVWNGVLQEVR